MYHAGSIIAERLNIDPIEVLNSIGLCIYDKDTGADITSVSELMTYIEDIINSK